jgi:hypothetical protein
VTSSSTTITSTAAQYGSTTLTVTSYSGFQAGVSLTCTGLPANAYCIFRPGLISLTSITNGTGPTATTSIPVQTTEMEIRVDQNPVNIQSAAGFGVLGTVTGMFLFFGVRRKTRKTLRRLAICCLLGMVNAAVLASLSGCGSGSSSSAYPTPAGTYPVTLTVAGTPIPGGQAPTTANITSIATCASVAANQKALGLPNALTCQQTGSYLITTASSSGLSANETMTVSGVTPSSFDGNYTVVGDTSENLTTNGVISYYDLIEFVPPSGAPATATGGVVRLANLSFSEAFTLIVK